MERENYKLEECEALIKRVLADGGTFPFYPKGTSMKPVICEGTDQVFLKSIPEQIKKYDAILYKRESGEFVLHRVRRIEKDGYVMCGDNQMVLEYGIKRNQMLGIVCAIQRQGRKKNVNTLSYKFYVRVVLYRKKMCSWKYFLSRVLDSGLPIVRKTYFRRK